MFPPALFQKTKRNRVQICSKRFTLETRGYNSIMASMVNLLKILRVAARHTYRVRRRIGRFAALVLLPLRVVIVGTLLLAMRAAQAGLHPNRSRQGAASPTQSQRVDTNRPRATGRRGDGRQCRPAGGGAERERGHVAWPRVERRNVDLCTGLVGWLWRGGAQLLFSNPYNCLSIVHMLDVLLQAG